MTYATGSIILASDLNGFLASTNNIYGVGTGDRGYGQTTIQQAAVKIGDIIRSTHWTNLRNMIMTCANHQATLMTLMPPAGVFAVGQLVIAYPGTSYEFKADLNAADQPTGGISLPDNVDFRADLNGGDDDLHQVTSDAFSGFSLPIYVTAIETNRLNVAPTALSVASGVWSITRSTTWSTPISAEVSATWATEDAVRAYFNSGGQIRLRGSQAGNDSQSLNWNATLTTGLGTLKFAVHGTSNTGSSSGSSSIGYYELTNNYQNIFVGGASASGSGYTSGDSIVIAAKRLNFAGVRGGNGTGVQFQITLSDTGNYSSVVNAAGMTFTFDNTKATTFLTGIASPTYKTIDSF